MPIHLDARRRPPVLANGFEAPEARDGRKDYAIRGKTSLGALLTSASVQMASPRGFERNITAFASRIEVPQQAWLKPA